MKLLPQLRVVLTNKCPYRCPHCHSEGSSAQNDLSRVFLLKILKSALETGFLQVTLTGGEPTCRSDLVEIITDIHSIGKRFFAKLSTSGYMLAKYASDLREAGLVDVNVSLLSLHDGICKRFTDSFSKIDEAVDVAKDVGLRVDLNTVLMRTINDNETINLIEYATKKEVDLTFMDLVWVPEKAAFYNKHFISLRHVEKLLFNKADDVSILIRSAPKLVFSMPEGTKIFLKSKELNRLVRVPMCKNCVYDQRCTEGLYAIRIDGSGRVYPCLLPTFETSLEEGMSSAEINQVLRRTIEYIFQEDILRLRTKSWFDYISAFK